MLDGGIFKEVRTPRLACSLPVFSRVSVSLEWVPAVGVDDLMGHYKFINAGHTCPPGIMYCDFKDIGNLVNVVAKHDRE